MKTVCVAWMGYNQVKVYLGVFKNVEEAKSKFLAAGCEVLLANSLTYKSGLTYPSRTLIVVTAAFGTWLSINVKDCPGLYSTGGNMVRDKCNIEFDTVAFNAIVRGYDDD